MIDVMSELEKMCSGAWYDPADAELDAARRLCQELLARFNTPGVGGSEAREALHGLLGSVGEGAQLMPTLRADYGFNIRLGRDVFINYDLVALDCAEITIGDGTLIGPRCQLLTPIHPLDDVALRRSGAERAEPIVLEENVWLGGGVIVNPGVRIGAGSVIGSGSVVTRDIPAGVFAAGVPARIVRELRPGEPGGA